MKEQEVDMSSVSKEEIQRLFDVFNEIESNTDMPVARVQYTYRDKSGNVQMGSSISIEFSYVGDSIEKMYVATTKPGFMFFNNSAEGKKWIDENIDTIKKALINLTLSNR